MKLRKKLLLSCAALAACATTLVSTSYAWFVSNAEANVSGISGATMEGSASGNFLVANGNASTALANRAYTSQITLDAANLTNVKLSPATKATAATPEEKDDEENVIKEAVAIGDWVDKNGEKLASQTPYIEFTFWVLSTGNETEFNLTYDVVNTTSSLVKQTSYNANGMPTGIDQGETFEVNAVNAMRMEILRQDETSGTLGAITTVQTVQLDKAAASNTASTVTFDDDAGDANLYYYHLLNQKPYGCSNSGSPDATTTGAAALSPISITANTHTLLTFRIWLEGTDAGCFDSTLNQTFTLALKMSV